MAENSCIFPNFMKTLNSQSTSAPIPKHRKPEENYTKAHHNQIALTNVKKKI